MEENNKLDLNISEIIGEDSDPVSEATNESTEKKNEKKVTGRERSLLNLKSWKKGCKNPNPENIGKRGPRPLTRIRHEMVATLREQLESQIPTPLLEEIKKYFPKTNSKISSAEGITYRLILAGLSGESWAIQTILDRTEGKVAQPITTKQEISVIGKLNELSDSELDQEIQKRITGTSIGEGTPPGTW
jgi:hypothetical protein